MTALAEFSSDRTLLLVTHRRAGLQLADEVYYLQEGHLTRQEVEDIWI